MKKVLAVLLVLVMLFAFTACNSTPDSTDEKKAPPTLTYLYNEGDGHKAIGEYLQGAFAAAGINLTLESQEWNTFLNTRKEGQFTIARNGWLGDYNDP
ncbi:MAG: hypothetical protein IKY44_05575, partial [Clostridia bacterium]|nr:hypothetical protein [Clostridia bacterium]